MMVLFFLISNTNLLDTCLVPALPGWGAQKCPKIVPVLQPWRGGREELGNSPADSQDPREPCNPHSRPAGLEGEPGWSVAEKDHRGEEQGECEGQGPGPPGGPPSRGNSKCQGKGVGNTCPGPTCAGMGAGDAVMLAGWLTRPQPWVQACLSMMGRSEKFLC